MAIRRFIESGLALAMLVAGAAAYAQGYPARPVRIILPYAAGGGADALTRVVAEALADYWKQPVLVDNRPGAGATIGTDMVAKSAPDGYTLLMTAATMAVSPSAYARLPYDVLKDFAPITLLAQSPYVLAVNAKVPAQNFAELLRLARSAPGKLNFGSPGNGTLSHLTFELLRSRTGLQAAVIAYKGSNPALVDALSGQVDFILDTPAAVMPHAKSQKLRALAVTSARRAAVMPTVPAIAESGVRDFDVPIWFGLLAPAGTAADIVRKIHDDVVVVLALPPVTQRLSAEGLDPVTMQPAEFGAILRRDISKWAAVVKQTNIRFE
jgi:tripartite-type tricarboxylate transporter receptor subunit TctC